MSCRRIRSLAFIFCLASPAACNTTTKKGSGAKVTGGEIVSTSKDPIGKIITKNVVTLKVLDGYCTGTLIAPKLVITAGHCITQRNGPFIVYFSGAISIDQRSQIIEPENVLLHKDFDKITAVDEPANDLVLLRLSTTDPSPDITVPIISANSTVKTISGLLLIPSIHLAQAIEGMQEIVLKL